MQLASPSTETPYSVEDETVYDDPFDVPWHREAACYRVGYDLHFWESKVGIKAAVEDAKSFCRAPCPVRDQCLRSALGHRDRYGVWGGLTARERQELLDDIDAGELTLEEAVQRGLRRP